VRTVVAAAAASAAPIQVPAPPAVAAGVYGGEVCCGSDADPGMCSASSDSRTERVRDCTCGACDADVVCGVAATQIQVYGSGTACVIVLEAPATRIEVCFRNQW